MATEQEQRDSLWEDLVQDSAGEDSRTLDQSPAAGPVPVINHPAAIILSWVLCGALALLFYLNPLAGNAEAGQRSVEVRLGIAMYHAAHHIENYHRRNGQLPEYLDAAWNESANVEYSLTSEGYRLTGRLGELERVYRSGDEPEDLLREVRN